MEFIDRLFIIGFINFVHKGEGFIYAMEISQEGISPMRKGEYSPYGKIELRRLVL